MVKVMGSLGEGAESGPIGSIGNSKPGINVVFGFRQRLRSLCGLGLGAIEGGWAASWADSLSSCDRVLSWRFFRVQHPP